MALSIPEALAIKRIRRYSRIMASTNRFTDLLTKVPLFSACSKKEIDLIDRRTETVNVAAGKVLVTEGAAGAEFFIIVSGAAEVSRHGQRVATLGSGDFFGDLALLDRAPRNATVTTTEPSELVVLGQREFAGIVDEVPGFANKLLAGLARRLREYDAQSVQ